MPNILYIHVGQLCLLHYFCFIKQNVVTHLYKLKGESRSGLGSQGSQHPVIDEFLCMVVGCALGPDVCHWMLNTKSTWFKVKKIPL